MSLFGRAAGVAGAVAREQAERAARRAVRKGMAMLGVGVFIVLTLVFAAVAGFVALEQAIGTVWAALTVSAVSLVFALILMAVARGGHPPRNTQTREIEAEIDEIAREAREEVRKASPYIVAAAFLSGFVFGRKD